jgi:hypothetical protein
MRDREQPSERVTRKFTGSVVDRQKCRGEGLGCQIGGEFGIAGPSPMERENCTAMATIELLEAGAVAAALPE